jgi:hypothetical protein
MNDDNSQIYFRNYVVVYLDILGQTDALRKFPIILRKDADLNSLPNSFIETYGKAHKLRSDIKNYYENFWAKVPEYNNLSAQKRETIDRMKGNEIKFQPLSDAIVIYNKLNNSMEEVYSIMPIYIMLGGSVMNLLSAFSNDIAIRGGMEIGVAADWEDFGIYGSALYNVIDLEKNVANYPRIVLGDEIMNCLEYWADNPKEDDLSRLNKKIADRCLSIIGEDGDGRPFIDFLSEKIPPFFENNYPIEKFCLLTVKESEFIRREYERFKKERNSKLTWRYKLLLDYFSAPTIPNYRNKM